MSVMCTTRTLRVIVGRAAEASETKGLPSREAAKRSGRHRPSPRARFGNSRQFV